MRRSSFVAEPAPAPRPAEAPVAPGPVRVMMIVERLYALGGAQQQALRLSRALEEHGVRSSIVTGRWRRAEPRRAELEGVPVTAVFTAFKGFHVKGLRKFGVYLYMVNLFLHLLLRRREFDVIHVHSATVSALVAAFAGRKLGKPVVMKVMASGQWGDFKRMRSGEVLAGARRLMRRLLDVDRVVCLNRQVADECLEEGFVEEQLFPVPNGFPIDGVAARDSYPDRDELEVVFSGRLDPQKNPDLLLEASALAMAVPGAPRMRVRFLGDGPLASSLEERARALGLEDRVRFLGRVNDVPRHLAEADIFVLPSLSEGISNALLEALAHGVPAIATDIPGNRDLIEDGRTGILVPSGDAPALSGALLRLAVDRALRQALGRGGRHLVEDRFDLRKVAGLYAEMYREIVQSARA